MSSQKQTTTRVPSGMAWNANDVFKMFADPVRRKLLLAIATQDQQTPTELRAYSQRSRDLTSKRLESMLSEGFVVMKPDPEDNRRRLFSLEPGMPVRTIDNRKVLDFGFLTVPLSGWGDAEREGSQAGGVRWMPDLIYPALGESARRQLLLALAQTPGQTADQLKSRTGLKVDATLKHLIVLRSAGLVTKTEVTEQDRRRHRYALTPGVRREHNENGVVFDFNFCRVTLS